MAFPAPHLSSPWVSACKRVVLLWASVGGRPHHALKSGVRCEQRDWSTVLVRKHTLCACVCVCSVRPCVFSLASSLPAHFSVLWGCLLLLPCGRLLPGLPGPGRQRGARFPFWSTRQRRITHKHAYLLDQLVVGLGFSDCFRHEFLAFWRGHITQLGQARAHGTAAMTNRGGDAVDDPQAPFAFKRSLCYSGLRRPFGGSATRALPQISAPRVFVLPFSFTGLCGTQPLKKPCAFHTTPQWLGAC